MDEVGDLLTAWGIPDLIPTFARNGITIQSLSALNVDEIKELIPLVGPRALFIRSWKVWLKTITDENAVICRNIEDVNISSCNISLSELQNISILQEQETQTATTPEKKNSNKVEKVSPNKNDTENLELTYLLKENFEATCLTQYVGECLPNENARNLLALVIAKHILKQNKNLAITGAVYNKWCRDIKALFPSERTTTYYIPACVTVQGISIQARGKLVSQVLNTRRKYQKLGVLDKRSSIPGISNLEHNSTPEVHAESSTVLESLTWLEHSSSPWSLVQIKWNETSERRELYLKEPQGCIEDYIKKYPALQKPEGYTLLMSDFEKSYPAQKNNLYLNFPLVKENLIKLLNAKKTKDAYHCELVQLSKAADEEFTNLAAILSLPELISPNVVLISDKDCCSAGPSASKKLKGISKRRWKPTKAESREAFVLHVKDDSYLQEVVLNNDTIQMERFEEIPFPLNFTVRLFNITNPDEVLNGEVPVLTEIGPYVYKMYSKRLIQSMLEDKVMYQKLDTFEFDANASFPNTEDDVVHIANVAYHGVLQIAEKDFPNAMSILNRALPGIFGSNTGPIMQVRVGDLMLDGIKLCRNPDFFGTIACALVRQFSANIKNMEVQEDSTINFSALGYRNGKPSDQYDAYRGIVNPVDLGRITAYGARPRLTYWGEESPVCNMINGTDSGIFNPLVKKEQPLYSLNSDICRSVELRYQYDVEYKGVPAYRFTANEWFLDNDDGCFCLNMTTGITRPDGCLFEGAMELYSCLRG